MWLKPAFLKQEPVVSLLLHLVKLVLMIGVDTRDRSGSLTLVCNLKPLQTLSLGSGRMREGMGVRRAEKIEKQQRKIKGEEIYLTWGFPALLDYEVIFPSLFLLSLH